MEARVPAVRTFLKLSWGDRLLLVEAAASLCVAALAVALVPFKTIGRWASLGVASPMAAGATRDARVNCVRWAVLAVARRVPWRAKCFEQGLAAQFMLRRRKIPTSLFYGAAMDEAGALIAHVWVRDGARDVVGGEAAPRFAVLACFPPAAK